MMKRTLFSLFALVGLLLMGAADAAAPPDDLQAVYYVWDVPNDEILVYWTAALTRNGYRTGRVGGRTADRDFLNFAGPLRGKISLSPRAGGFVLVEGPS